MNARKSEGHCVIIGAGMSGLVAAARLQEAGFNVIVLESGSDTGGRMRAVRVQVGGGPSAVFDCGAQFFTVREPLFERMVTGWLAKGLISEWSRGFATADGSFYADGHPRYRGVPDMAAVPRELAKNLDVRLSTKVEAVRLGDDGWMVHLENGRSLSTGAVILTPPVPQSMALMAGSGISLNQANVERLSKINYEPCIALLVQLDGPGRIPDPGGMWPLGEPIAWVADNFRKGVSPVPGAITIHAGPEFSTDHWTQDDPIMVAHLLAAVDLWLAAPIRATRVFRWQYSKPYWIHPDPFLAISEPAPLIFAGDAFAGPRVEGAALSGLAAADWLVDKYG